VIIREIRDTVNGGHPRFRPPQYQQSNRPNPHKAHSSPNPPPLRKHPNKEQRIAGFSAHPVCSAEFFDNLSEAADFAEKKSTNSRFNVLQNSFPLGLPDPAQETSFVPFPFSPTRRKNQ